MAASKALQFLICYDIADPKRLGRVHRLLKKTGLPVQYSVFSVICTKTRVLRLLARIESLMDEREDDVRCYTMPTAIECKTLGRQVFPDDVFLFKNGVSSLIGRR